MEIDDIKGFWKAENMRIAAHVKVNREASFQKLHLAFNKIRVRRLLHLVAICVYLPLLMALLVFPGLQNDGSIGFYLGFAAFMVPITAIFLLYIYRYIRLLKIDFTTSLLKAQKEIRWLERLDRRRNMCGLLIAPLTIWGTFRMFGIPFQQNTLLVLVFMGVLMALGYLARMKVLIPREYNKIKSLLDEIENYEKD